MRVRLPWCPKTHCQQRAHPSGAKSFIVNYRDGDGGQKAANKGVVLGHYGQIAPDQARRLARNYIGRIANGDDPAAEHAAARGIPTIGDAFQNYMAANPNRSPRTNELYRYEANRAMSLLRSVYRRPCVDVDGLRNPVNLWLAGGGKFHRKARRKIATPAEVLPC